MRKSFVSLLSLVLFLGVLLTVGCGGGGGGGSSPVAATSDGSLADLRGQVTYNGNAVPKASVYLMKATSDEAEMSRRASVMGAAEPDFSVLTADGNGYQTTSDANGYYTFTQVPVGTYTVQALISPSIQVAQSVVLGSISNLDLALKPTGSISGKITMNGSPIQGIVYLEGTSYMSIAGLDGSFKILNVPVETIPYTLIPVLPGSYYSSVRVQTPAGQISASQQPAASVVQGGVRASSGIYTFKNSPVQVTPVAGTNTDLGTLELIAAMGTLTGTALIEGSNMHSGIYVSTSGSSAYTDSEGKYTLENVYFGQRTITFSKYYGSEDYTASTIVLVDSVATKTVATVTLLPEVPTTANVSGTITGIVAPGGQTQYPNSYIYLYQDGTQVDSRYLYVSGTTATYDFSEIATGAYSIVLQAYNNYQLASVAVTLAAGDAKTQDIALIWTKAAVSGTVTGVNSNYPATINLWKNGSIVDYQAGLYNNSTYCFVPLDPGVYSVAVDTNSGYTTASYAVSLSTGNQKSQNFSLTLNVPTVTAASFNPAGTTLTVTGTNFNSTNAEILVDDYPITVTSRTGTTGLEGNADSVIPGTHAIKVRNNAAVSSLPLSAIAKQFTVGPATTTSAIGMNSYTMNWNYLPGATQYLVYMNGTYVTSTTSYSYTFTGLTPNTAYTFGVEATGNGISNSPRTNVTVTTSRVFNAPIVYDSTRSIGTLVKSFVYGGYLYAIGNTGGSYSIVRYYLANPASPADAPVALQDPVMPGYSAVKDLYVDSTGVYVGWTESISVYLQRYNLAPTTPVNSYSASFPMAALGIKLKANNNSGVTAALQAVSWNSVGVASLTYLNTTLGAVATTAITLPVTPTTMEWTSYIGIGNSPRTALMISAGAGGYIVDSNPAFTASTTAFFSGSVDDLAGSPNLGYAWGGSGNIVHYVTNTITLVPGYLQTAFDANNRLYTITNTPYSIARYSAVGNREDGIALPNLESPAFGKRVIHYDAVNDQIVAIASAGSNLGVMTFPVQN